MSVAGKSRDWWEWQGSRKTGWWEWQGSRGTGGSDREVEGLVGVAGKPRD